MKKLILSGTVLAVLLYSMTRPAFVQVGPIKVAVNHTKGYVAFANLVGDTLGYGRCMISGTSLYWSVADEYLAREKDFTDSKFLSDSGSIVSIYAAKGIREIKSGYGDRIAYLIAQQSFVMDMIEHNSYDGTK